MIVPRCEIEGCNFRAFHNISTEEKKGIFCKTHRHDGMANVYKCLINDCEKTGYLKKEEKDIELYCKDHATEEMSNMILEKCQDCNKVADYNYKNGESGVFCSEHRLKGMINIYKNICIIYKCLVGASYKNENENIYTHCKQHAIEDMKDKEGNVYIYKENKNRTLKKIIHLQN